MWIGFESLQKKKNSKKRPCRYWSFTAPGYSYMACRESYVTYFSRFKFHFMLYNSKELQLAQNNQLIAGPYPCANQQTYRGIIHCQILGVIYNVFPPPICGYRRYYLTITYSAKLAESSQMLFWMPIHRFVFVDSYLPEDMIIQNSSVHHYVLAWSALQIINHC